MDEAEVASSPSRRRTFDTARVPFRHCTNCYLIYRGDKGIISQNLKQSDGHLSGILKLKKNKKIETFGSMCKTYVSFRNAQTNTIPTSDAVKCICTELFISDAVCVCVCVCVEWQ